MLKQLVLTTAWAFCATGVQAHEFWVEPQPFQVLVGEQLQLDLRVGQMLEGRSYPYLSHKFARFTVDDATHINPLAGNEGDIPAMTYQADTPGLHVISYHALPERLTYDSFADFAAFLEEEGLAEVILRHRARGLLETGFSEGYSRNAKALVQVGAPEQGQTDRVAGLPFELVALENPYAAQDQLHVRLLWQGAPFADAQVTLFHRPTSGEVTRQIFRTDAGGGALIPFTASGTYLLSAVHMEERPAESGEVWHSTWASLSFGWAAGVKP
ncbi:MAG: DUF4198 domain-containing protein [Pseudotabrizicola sp.]|uniref:DUF4198 domain-containing protein n=1 Tax=Pseudotabrizicola sp. TaxID=2939647 RepID=UPI00272FAB74|nr:DUF4198 domain-containing protein [Pseudotabrizicola sp.]MDP2081595.1 DUF4198 domain-containing protein [Pseudotabrizicola sp.]MDZ7576411.1 DUF4198 domain-containing protein [Pseudotabrizicola sp.]